MLPDEFLAQNVAKETNVKIIAWKGHCEVHERFTEADITLFREQNPGVVVLAHPECPPSIVEASDFSGSTAGMIDWVATHKPARVVLLTECSMSDNVAVSHPSTQFVRPCQLCPHMKRITLANIRSALENMEHVVTIPSDIFSSARRAVERMIMVR
jgi:quinolinate synthase